ncbi:MAG: C40 family peptidase, partial [Spirochaetaceae bacterium]|nr:C40 family peptidase [Spirochaetaceae bacterium]
NPPRAFDCSGFVGQAYKEGANVVLPRTSKALAAAGTPVNRNNIKPGDIIYFDVRGYGVISHVALVLDSGNMIHAVAEGKGMAITPLNDKWYAPKIAGYRSLFSGGEVSLSGGIRDGIAAGARGTDRPLSEVFLEVTGKPEKSADQIILAMETGLHFTLINQTGKDADFDVYFYQKGTTRDKGDHERISVKSSAAKELVHAFFAEKAGQYTVEVRTTAGALIEKTWIVE